jgi:AraC-like DNA-binding protein/mannose-6-phosphate isomerase-like protein (cupin superfamily)
VKLRSPQVKRTAQIRGKAAYKAIVDIVRSYHSNISLPLSGLSMRQGHVVLQRESVCSTGCPIAVMRIPEHPAYPVHRHSFHEISIVLEGVATTVVDGHSFEISAGDVFVIHGSHEHSIENPQGLKILNVCYDARLLAIDEREFPDAPSFRALFHITPSLRRNGVFNKHLRLNSKQLSKIETLATEMDVEIQQRNPGYVSVARSQLLEIIALLSRWHAGVDQKDLCDARRIAKALLWFEQHYEDDFSIPQLCRACGLSRRQFFRVFKACTNQTPAQYQMSIRLRRAKELLLDSTMNITQVAFACGFKDSNHFSRSFKALTGISPRDHKKAHQIVGGYRASKTKHPN